MDATKPTTSFCSYWTMLQELLMATPIGETCLTGTTLDIPSVVAIARFGRTVTIHPQALSKIEKSSIWLQDTLREGTVVYGVNTGVGSAASSRPQAGHNVQESIMHLLTHGILIDEGPSSVASSIDEMGSVSSMPQPWIRAAMAIRINSFAAGASGVRPILVQTLASALNNDLVPLVPLRGSISASGDLSPLSYIAAMLQGRPSGRVYTGNKGERRLTTADEALKGAGIPRVDLFPKEALALVNGTAVSAAVGALVVFEAESLMATAQVLTAMAVESLAGSVESFDPLFAQLRPHPGQVECAHNVHSFLTGTSMAFAHGQNDEKQQDRYSIRTASQWLGPVLEDLALAGSQVHIELNSVTDNPLLASATSIMHGGNFQAKAVTSAMEKIRQGCETVGHMLYTQCTELMDPSTSQGLSPNLVVDEPNESWLWKAVDVMIAALASELGFLANPVGSHVKPAESGNQAINSLALISGRYTLTALDILTQLSAIHMLACCQAMDLRALDYNFMAELKPKFAATLLESLADVIIPPSDSAALAAKLWQIFETFWRTSKTMNSDVRIVASLDSMDAVILTHCTETTETLQALRAFKMATSKLALETWTKTRESYIAAPDATAHLGVASKRIYRFIRGQLGIPFASEQPLSDAGWNRTAAEGTGQPRKTFASLGEMITVVYRSLKSTELYGVVAECHMAIKTRTWLTSCIDAKNFFVPGADYGVSNTVNPVRTLENAFASIDYTHNKLAIVRNNLTGGLVDQVIANLSATVRAAGKIISIEDDPVTLSTTCRTSLLGGSSCLGGLVFHSSPTEGNGSIWNYTLYTDGNLGSHIYVQTDSNDQQLYSIPLQHAVDRAIAATDSSINSANLPKIQEFPYTSQTEAERDDSIRRRYASVLISFLGVGFFIGICGITYQQVGLQAVEREIKMSPLMEVMMPNKRRWEPQLARLVSYWIAFSILYLPGWIIMAIIIKVGVFAHSSVGILIIHHLLTGLALSSSGLFVAAFFRKAQLSGITSILINLILAIVAQVTMSNVGNGGVAILSLIFPSANYVYFISFMARFERRGLATDLSRAAPISRSPRSAYDLAGYVFWILLIVQIVLYPVLAALVERGLWGTTSKKSRKLQSSPDYAIELNDFSKTFKSNRFFARVKGLFGRKPRADVHAVDGLNLKVRKGEILVFLGANGAGKSTTLDAISGLSSPTRGSISVDFENGLGFCPQQNVLWNDVTVKEHVNIFSSLKALGKPAPKSEQLKLIQDCDLDRKVNARAGSLSGGQLRKLQLAAMFTGGSGVCLVDEISSGLDPLARRKIQDIIFAERDRSKRSIIFTTHFLDEAENVADSICILSRGRLRLEGTVPEIKTQSKGTYRVHLQITPDSPELPDLSGLEGVNRRNTEDEVILEVAEPSQAAKLLSHLEEDGSWTEYSIQGPSLQDAFMGVAEEMALETLEDSSSSQPSSLSDKKAIDASPVDNNLEKRLQSGHPITPFRQTVILFQKRWTVFRRNPFPNIVALLLPFIAAGLVTLFLRGFQRAGCNPADQVSISDSSTFGTVMQDYNVTLAVGPSSRFSVSDINLLTKSLGIGQNGMSSGSGGSGNATGGLNLTSFSKSLHFVETMDDFQSYIRTNYRNVTPGGFFFAPDNTATFAYVANIGLVSSVLMQNLVDILSLKIPLATDYNTFSIPWQADQGNTLQFAIYFGLVLSISPAFFSLYPTMERLRKVRGFQYSNGVRALALWPSYLVFDVIFMTLGVSISVILFAGVKASVFYDMGLFWFVLVLYGITATLASYVISLFANSQLAAFAVAAAYGAISLLLYLIGYLATLSYAPVNLLDQYQSYVYFTITLVLPAGHLLRAIFVALNMFSVNCRDTNAYVSSGGNMLAYGGPITYLILQAVVLSLFLVWWDSGFRFGSIVTFFGKKSKSANDREDQASLSPEVAAELRRAESATDDGLTALHLSKYYGKNLAVDDISFGIAKDEVFALLGPNGAGKSTTISMIRGDLRPTAGNISIDDMNLFKQRTGALQRLGVCPQFDALDQLSVVESLRFYARVRGVPDVEQNVQEIIRAVGLGKFKDRMSMALSGGNKRKLSLGVALMGNPALVMLDEPSSGMDVAAKRIMWRTLKSVGAGRSILLVTHSMEEADALANRAGIIAKRFLAFGTSSYLRKKHGDRYHVHIVLRSAPHTSDEEAAAVKAWVLRTFNGAEVESRLGHGQIRFSVPASHGRAVEPKSPKVLSGDGNGTDEASNGLATQEQTSRASTIHPNSNGQGIASVFATLETAKMDQGFDYYTVSQTNLDQVFLNVVEKHNVEEEDYNHKVERKGKKTTKDTR